jgi:hypothetical protein
MHFCCSPHMLHALHIPFFLIWSHEYLVRSRDRKISCHVVFPIPMLPHPLLGPDIFLSTLFSSTLSPCYSLTVREQVPHPYKTTGKRRKYWKRKPKKIWEFVSGFWVATFMLILKHLSWQVVTSVRVKVSHASAKHSRITGNSSALHQHIPDMPHPQLQA